MSEGVVRTLVLAALIAPDENGRYVTYHQSDANYQTLERVHWSSPTSSTLADMSDSVLQRMGFDQKMQVKVWKAAEVWRGKLFELRDILSSVV